MLTGGRGLTSRFEMLSIRSKKDETLFENKIETLKEPMAHPRQGVGSVDDNMVDEAIARKARLILERAGIAAEDQVLSSSTDMKTNN